LVPQKKRGSLEKRATRANKKNMIWGGELTLKTVKDKKSLKNGKRTTSGSKAGKRKRWFQKKKTKVKQINGKPIRSETTNNGYKGREKKVVWKCKGVKGVGGDYTNVIIMGKKTFLSERDEGRRQSRGAQSCVEYQRSTTGSIVRTAK